MIGHKITHTLLIISFLTNFIYGLPENYGLDTSLKIISRSEWGARPSTDNRPLNVPVPYVVIHHTYIPAACKTTEQCIVAMQSMQNAHIDNGWGDIGYNFCLGNDGTVYEGRGWENIGIHAGKANSISVGICLIGDWRVETPPTAMLDATQALIEVGVEDGYISPTYRLVGHKQVMATECPGTALFNIISTWDHFTKDFTTN